MTAHVDLDTHTGQAWVGLRLRVILGSVPVQKDQRRPPTAKNRNPSYFSWQARRKATRESYDAELNAEEAQTKATNNLVAAAKNAEKASEAINENENIYEVVNEAAKASNEQGNMFNC